MREGEGRWQGKYVLRSTIVLVVDLKTVDGIISPNRLLRSRRVRSAHVAKHPECRSDASQERTRSQGRTALTRALGNFAAHSPKILIPQRMEPCALDGSVGSAVETLDVLIYAYAIPEWTIDIDGHMGFC